VEYRRDIITEGISLSFTPIDVEGWSEPFFAWTARSLVMVPYDLK
jgi:hypothetical protein